MEVVGHSSAEEAVRTERRKKKIWFPSTKAHVGATGLHQPAAGSTCASLGDAFPSLQSAHHLVTTWEGNTHLCPEILHIPPLLLLSTPFPPYNILEHS